MPIRSSGWPTRWLSALAASAAGVAVAACARPAPGGRPGAEPDVRVGIVSGVAEVRLGAPGAAAAVAAGRAVFRLARGDEIRVEAEGRALRVEGAAQGWFESLTLTSLEPRRYLEVNGRPYRGVVDLFAEGGRVTAVNVVSLEAYVAGVVNAEMGRRAREERAALEAQAVVSRTYVLANLGKFATRGYDVQATVADQAYGGIAAETEEGWAAVRATAGLVATHDGRLVQPFFHSTCGHTTAAPEESFRSVRGTAYLRPVSDRRPGGGYYCDISPRFRWRVAWDGVELAAILRRTVPAVVGVEAEAVDAVRDVTVRRTGPSGRVAELRIRVGRGEIPVFGPDIRTVFRRPDGGVLGSTSFELAANHGADGAVRRLTANGSGWGHGVGMCQWGAVGRARAGQDFRRIVTTYFPGVTIERWY